mmetsp:Transcript_4226/g.8282  ORF Transcript_4226/g.8282 Transcript_4226/m.8282 type:complete len:250 (+) Transcript_4226:485-1234(+)
MRSPIDVVRRYNPIKNALIRAGELAYENSSPVTLTRISPTASIVISITCLRISHVDRNKKMKHEYSTQNKATGKQLRARSFYSSMPLHLLYLRGICQSTLTLASPVSSLTCILDSKKPLTTKERDVNTIPAAIRLRCVIFHLRASSNGYIIFSKRGMRSIISTGFTMLSCSGCNPLSSILVACKVQTLPCWSYSIQNTGSIASIGVMCSTAVASWICCLENRCSRLLPFQDSSVFFLVEAAGSASSCGC